MQQLRNFLKHFNRPPPRNTFNADYESDSDNDSTNNNFEIKRNDSVNSLEYYPFPTTLDRWIKSVSWRSNCVD